MGYMNIVDRKGSKNKSDALSRREDLAELTEESIIDNPIHKKKFEDYDVGIFEKELEDLRESLTEMTHLQCDNHLITEICNGYLQDSHFIGTTLLAGVTLDPKTGLYWITDKIFVPNILSLSFITQPATPISRELMRSFYAPFIGRTKKRTLNISSSYAQSVKVSNPVRTNPMDRPCSYPFLSDLGIRSRWISSRTFQI
jgi:hypothetical protein